MKVFMLGWEFPPFISGGLGTACYGLTKAMSGLGMEIIFVLPRASHSSHSSHVKMLSAEGYAKLNVSNELKNVKFRTIQSSLTPYGSIAPGIGCKFQKKTKYNSFWQNNTSDQVQNYGGDIYEQVHLYAAKAVEISNLENFDVIHAHDWMTYLAGIAVAQNSGKPLVVQVHSTEFDRSGENINQMVYDIERRGMHSAQKIISVSNFTKNIVTGRYGISPDKVEVVYNGIESTNNYSFQVPAKKSGKTVLFLGRITMQKGPEYFIAAAKKVLEKVSNVRFVMAGDGDMMHKMIEYAARLGIGHKILFTKFLRGADVENAYRMADLYVMPSVSEPFGIAPLEAVKHGAPVLISRQSGISEILKNALKVDFWDINQMANKILAVVKHSPLGKTLQENSSSEIGKFRWEDSAAKLNKIYNEMLACVPVI